MLFNRTMKGTMSVSSRAHDQLLIRFIKICIKTEGDRATSCL